MAVWALLFMEVILIADLPLTGLSDRD